MGVEVKDIKLVSKIVQRLLASSSSNANGGKKLQVVREKVDIAPGETEERQHCFGPHRPHGMANVLQKLLERENVEPSFGHLGLG